MTDLLTFTIVGVVSGCVYALAASGIVVTYTTSGIFNFAHGGVGMILAFAFWDLAVNHGWPMPLALLVTLGVLAPLMGALIERLLMRKLHGSSTGTALVVTLGLLLALIGVGLTVWDQSKPRTPYEFFAGHTLKLGGIVITYHQVTALVVALLVAGGLRLLFYRTRIGIAMRAVVDDPELAALNGAAPARVAQVSWALGAMLAGIAGILLAPLVRLEVLQLTLVIFNAFAACVVGRLKSLPLTFIGALVIGVTLSYGVWLSSTSAVPDGVSSFIKQIQPALPTVILFVALLISPQARLRAGRLVTFKSPRVPNLRESVIGGAALVAGVWLVTGWLSRADVIHLGQGLSLAFIMLSLVLLTGYGGQVSLCQLTFVGIGGFVMGKIAGGDSLLGVLLATAAAGAVGALVALPALRLQGLYLALATLAFAQGMDLIFFQNDKVFSFGGKLDVGRVHLPGLSFGGDRSFVILLAVLFAVTGAAVLALRRGPFGRRLSAMSDSPAACATLGLNLVATKLAVFTLSAAMAGFAGVFFAGFKGSASPIDFQLLQSLILLLLVTIGGINTVSGALIGGLVFALFPVMQEHISFLKGGSLQYLLTGLGAMSLGRNPNGLAGQMAELGERVKARLPRRREEPVVSGEVDRLAGVAS